MKLLKIVLLLCVLILLIGLVALGSLYFFVDPNKMRPVIIAEVKQSTGYELTLPGKLAWSFYPRLSIKVDHLLLNAPHEAPFLELQDVRIAARPMQLLHGIKKLKGDLFIEKARFAKVHAESISLALQWRHHILTIQDIKGSFYEGSFAGTIHGKNLAASSAWDWDLHFNHFSLEPLLNDIGPNAKLKLSGLGEVNLQGNTQGHQYQDLLSHTNGSANFKVSKGLLSGLDINYYVDTADGLLNKNLAEMPKNINQTTFDQFTGNFSIKNGVAETKDLLLSSKSFVGNGQGKVLLSTEVLDMSLQIKPQRTLTEARKNWEVPLLITGALKDPDVRIDTEKVQKLIADQEFDKIKGKASEEIKKHIHGKAGQFLQQLLGD